MFLLGGDGVLAAQRGEVHAAPICKAEMRNATGAGDAMMASLVWSFLSGRTLAESAAAGTAAAALAVESEETINPAMRAPKWSDAWRADLPPLYKQQKEPSRSDGSFFLLSMR